MKDWFKSVEYHHSYVKSIADEHGDYTVLWTSLIGSQNYGLEGADSDCDTISVVLPSYLDFISNVPSISFEQEVADGKVIVKDFRLIMNLLRKTSPNSVEPFASHYQVFEPEYADLEDAFFQDETLFYLTHANYRNMINAIMGCAYGLHGRNMSFGKKLAHVIRLINMEKQFLSDTPTDILGFYWEVDRTYARIIKFESEEETSDEFHQKLYERLLDVLKEEVSMFEPTQEQRSIEYTAKCTINRLQFEVTKIYLKNNNFEYKE
jgi:predicted nucleotidyltransferase